MANGFEITISAVDKATEVFRKIDQQMVKSMKPIDAINKNMQAFGRASGLKDVGASLGKIGDTASDVARQVASILPPLAGIAGVASVAGLASLALGWGKAGGEITRTSTVLGMGVRELQNYRLAARAAGLTADDMTAGLKNVGNTFEDAVTGRNTQAAGVMAQYGIRLKRTKSGAVDAAAGLQDLAQAMQKLGGNAQARQKFAQIFGIDQLLPMLNHGKHGLQSYLDETKSMVMTDAQIAKAEKFNKTLLATELSFDRMKQAVGEGLAPAIQSLCDWLAKLDWNKISQDVKDFCGKVKDTVDWLGGWKQILIDIGLVMGVNLLANIAIAGGKMVWMAGIYRDLAAAATVAQTAIEAEAAATAAAGSATAAGGAAAGGGVAAGAAAGGTAASRAMLLFGKFAGGLGMLLTPEKMAGAEQDMIDPATGKMKNFTHNSSKQSIGLRQNNPGNLRKWDGFPNEGGFAKFDTMTQGIAAVGKQLQIYGSRGINTIDRIIPTYAPKSENNTAAYIDAVFKKTGLRPDQKINLKDNKVLVSVASAIIDQEVGAGHFTRAEVAAAINSYQARSLKAPGESSPPPTPAPTTAPTGPVVRANQPAPSAAPSAVPVASGSIKVFVEFANAPQGMRTQVTTTGPISPEVRIARSQLTGDQL